MTQQDDITQRVLTDDEIMRSAISACDSLNITRFHEIGAPSKTIMDDAGLLELGRAIETALLSKLRAPVADERAAFERDWRGHSDLAKDPLTGAFTHPGTQSRWAGWLSRAALASTPVAGEAQRRGKFLPEHVTQQMIWNVQAVIEAECNGLALDTRQARNVMSFLMNEHGPDAAPQASASQPVGRVRHFNYSGVARNGFSQEAVLNDDAPTLPDGALLYAAPQASECECSRKSKAVSDSEAQL